MSSRTPRGRRSGGSSEPSLPLVPVLVGVIVAGLAIGALFSSIGSHSSGGEPAATPSPPVVVVAPREAAPTPMPFEPTPVPRRRLRTPEPPSSPAPTVDPNAAGTLEPLPSVAPIRRARTPAAERTPRPETPDPTEPPAEPLPPPPSETPTPGAPAPVVRNPAPEPGVTGFPHEAEQLVRGYFAALKSQDPAAAYAALGAPVGGGRHGASTTAESMVGPAARIIHVEARGGADASAVDVSFRADGVTYFGHYIVERTPAGPVIRSHEVIRP